ncbi:MAG: radical SAM protein [Clostridiales bacterium]|nr:radical SAM protein [Clostridiales bacterium]
MERLLGRINGFDSVIIFGASDIGEIIHKRISPYCGANGIALCYADNSYKKWNDEKKIFRPAKASAKYPEALWILATDRHLDTMYTQLTGIGIGENHIIRELPDAVLQTKRARDSEQRLTPKTELTQLEVHIAHSCNLNCRGCVAFAPLVKEPALADLDIFKRDMRRLSVLFQNKLGVFTLIGGEPLLNPQINEFAECARRCFPDAQITIVTNGILLPKMPDQFWNACKENKVTVSVTRYPINLDYNAMEKNAEAHGVEFEFFGIAVDKTSWNFAFDPLGKQTASESFANCCLANCTSLSNGRITTCPIIQNADFFNAYFNTRMEVSSDDYIDIYAVESQQEILDFICKPVPFCRYCDVKNRTYDNPWGLSKREIGEWIIER